MEKKLESGAAITQTQAFSESLKQWYMIPLMESHQHPYIVTR